MQGDSKATPEGTPQGVTPQKGILNPPGAEPLNLVHGWGAPKPFWASPRSREEALRPPRAWCPHQGPVGGTPRSPLGKRRVPADDPAPKLPRPPRWHSHVLGGQVLALHDADGEGAAPGHGGRAAEPSGAERSQTAPSAASNPRTRAQRPCADRHRRPPISARGRGKEAWPGGNPRRPLGHAIDCRPRGVASAGGRGRAPRAARVPRGPPGVPAVPSVPPLCPRCVPAGSPLCPLGPLSPWHCPRFQGSSAPACLAQRPPVLDQTHTKPLSPHAPGGCSISRAALHPKPPAFY